MEITRPISPNENDKESISDYALDEAIQYFNQAISGRNWFNDDPSSDYYPVLIKPYGKYNKHLMDKVVEVFTEEGWDCNWGDYYMGGPTHCLFVHTKHFKK